MPTIRRRSPPSPMALPRAELVSRTAIESLFLPWVAGSGNSRSSFAETVGRSAECRRPFLSLQPRIPWGWLAAGPSPSCSSSDPAKRQGVAQPRPSPEIGLLGNTGEPAASMTIVGPCHDLRHTFVTPSLDSERGCTISRRSRSAAGHRSNGAGLQAIGTRRVPIPADQTATERRIDGVMLSRPFMIASGGGASDEGPGAPNHPGRQRSHRGFEQGCAGSRRARYRRFLPSPRSWSGRPPGAAD